MNKRAAVIQTSLFALVIGAYFAGTAVPANAQSQAISLISGDKQTRVLTGATRSATFDPLVVHYNPGSGFFNLAIVAGKLITFDCVAPTGTTCRVLSVLNSGTAIVGGNGDASVVVTVSGAAGIVSVRAHDTSNSYTFTLTATAPAVVAQAPTATPKPAATQSPSPQPSPVPTATVAAGPATPNPYTARLLASGGIARAFLDIATNKYELTTACNNVSISVNKGSTVLQTHAAVLQTNACTTEFDGLPETVDLVITSSSNILATVPSTKQTLMMQPAGTTTANIPLGVNEAVSAHISLIPDPTFVLINRVGILNAVVAQPSAPKGLVMPCASFTVTVSGVSGLPGPQVMTASYQGQSGCAFQFAGLPVAMPLQFASNSVSVVDPTTKVATALHLTPVTMTLASSTDPQTLRFTFGP